MSLGINQILDAVKITQKHQKKRGSWTDLTSDVQRYTVAKQLLNKKRAKEHAGNSIQFEAMKSDAGSARVVDMVENQTYEHGDHMLVGEVPWRHVSNYWSVIKRMIAMNSGPEGIVNYVAIQKAASKISEIKLYERIFWGRAESSDDTKTPYGLFNYLVPDNTNADTSYTSGNRGFYGGNPSGFASGIAGINSSTWERYKNFTLEYRSISRGEIDPATGVYDGGLIYGLRDAYEEMQFESPIDHPDTNTGDDYGLYTKKDVGLALASALENQNDNLGNDIASKDGKVIFRGIPLTIVPYLSNKESTTEWWQTTDPIFLINWGALQFHFLKGYFMNESEARDSPLNSGLVVADIETTMNLVCTDRRCLGVAKKADS